MTEQFDAYTQKTKLYYVLQTIGISTFLFLFVAKVADLQLPSPYQSFLIALVIFGLITMLISIFLTVTNYVQMYIKDGELIVNTESVILNKRTILLKDIQLIEINAKDYKGAKGSDGSGNRIYITVEGKVITTRFVINSKNQRDKLKEILTDWKSKGVEFF